MDHSEDNPIQIETAEIEDSGAIARLHVGAWQDSYKNFLPRDYLARLDIDTREASWRLALSMLGETEAVFIVRSADEVIGVVHVGPELSGDLDVDGEIYALYVAKASRGSGLAAALVGKGVETLRSCGFGSLSFWVFEENDRARRFLEKLDGKQLAYCDEVLLADKSVLELPYAWTDLEALLDRCQGAIKDGVSKLNP